MIIFSPFGKDSGGFVSTGGLGLSFAGVAALRVPYPPKRAIEIAMQAKSDLENFVLIVSPNLNREPAHSFEAGNEYTLSIQNLL
jgi:hypothetical protein